MLGLCARIARDEALGRRRSIGAQELAHSGVDLRPADLLLAVVVEADILHLGAQLRVLLAQQLELLLERVLNLLLVVVAVLQEVEQHDRLIALDLP